MAILDAILQDMTSIDAGRIPHLLFTLKSIKSNRYSKWSLMKVKSKHVWISTHIVEIWECLRIVVQKGSLFEQFLILSVDWVLCLDIVLVLLGLVVTSSQRQGLFCTIYQNQAIFWQSKCLVLDFEAIKLDL
jgi:hypothetical protein